MEIVFYLKKYRSDMPRFILCFVCSIFTTLFGIDFQPYEKSLYSQNGEDGILAKIFQLIPPSLSYCVEIGAADGITGSNTYCLRLQGWNSLLLDRAYENTQYNLHKQFLTAENINQIFDKYEVPPKFDLLSIDVGYNDFHLWNALDGKYRPSVVLIAYNGAYGDQVDRVVKYRPFYCGNQTDYFGASILALYHLGKAKGYCLAYAESQGSRLFFIREDLIQVCGLTIQDIDDVQKIYRTPVHERISTEIKNPIFYSSKDLIKNLQD